MTTLQQLHHIIDQIYLTGEDGDARCCKKLALSILHEQRAFYSYGDLLNIANFGTAECFNINDVQLAINVLKGTSIKLLREVYRYIDDDVIYDLSADELQTALKDGILDLELRGYPDRDFKSKVYVIFSADRSVVSNESNT